MNTYEPLLNPSSSIPLSNKDILHKQYHVSHGIVLNKIFHVSPWKTLPHSKKKLNQYIYIVKIVLHISLIILGILLLSLNNEQWGSYQRAAKTLSCRFFYPHSECDYDQCVGYLLNTQTSLDSFSCGLYKKNTTRLAIIEAVQHYLTLNSTSIALLENNGDTSMYSHCVPSVSSPFESDFCVSYTDHTSTSYSLSDLTNTNYTLLDPLFTPSYLQNVSSLALTFYMKDQIITDQYRAHYLWQYTLHYAYTYQTKFHLQVQSVIKQLCDIDTNSLSDASYFTSQAQNPSLSSNNYKIYVLCYVCIALASVYMVFIVRDVVENIRLVCYVKDTLAYPSPPQNEGGLWKKLERGLRYLLSIPLEGKVRHYEKYIGEEEESVCVVEERSEAEKGRGKGKRGSGNREAEEEEDKEEGEGEEKVEEEKKAEREHEPLSPPSPSPSPPTSPLPRKYRKSLNISLEGNPALSSDPPPPPSSPSTSPKRRVVFLAPAPLYDPHPPPPSRPRNREEKLYYHMKAYDKNDEEHLSLSPSANPAALPLPLSDPSSSSPPPPSRRYVEQWPLLSLRVKMRLLNFYSLFTFLSLCALLTAVSLLTYIQRGYYLLSPSPSFPLPFLLSLSLFCLCFTLFPYFSPTFSPGLLLGGAFLKVQSLLFSLLPLAVGLGLLGLTLYGAQSEGLGDLHSIVISLFSLMNCDSIFDTFQETNGGSTPKTIGTFYVVVIFVLFSYLFFRVILALVEALHFSLRLYSSARRKRKSFGKRELNKREGRGRGWGRGLLGEAGGEERSRGGEGWRVFRHRTERIRKDLWRVYGEYVLAKYAASNTNEDIASSDPLLSNNSNNDNSDDDDDSNGNSNNASHLS